MALLLTLVTQYAKFNTKINALILNVTILLHFIVEQFILSYMSSKVYEMRIFLATKQ
jgi:hypothetical protein